MEHVEILITKLSKTGPLKKILGKLFIEVTMNVPDSERLLFHIFFKFYSTNHKFLASLVGFSVPSEE